MNFFEPIECIFHNGCMDQIHAWLGLFLIIFCVAVAVSLIGSIVSMISLLYELDDRTSENFKRFLRLSASVDKLQDDVKKLKGKK